MALTVILGALLGAVGTACGTEQESNIGDPAKQGVTTQPTSGTTRATIYLLTDNGAAPIGVRRTIRTKSPYAREALKALLAGPTPEEEERRVFARHARGRGSRQAVVHIARMRLYHTTFASLCRSRLYSMRAASCSGGSP